MATVAAGGVAANVGRKGPPAGVVDVLALASASAFALALALALAGAAGPAANVCSDVRSAVGLAANVGRKGPPAGVVDVLASALASAGAAGVAANVCSDVQSAVGGRLCGQRLCGVRPALWLTLFATEVATKAGGAAAANIDRRGPPAGVVDVLAFALALALALAGAAGPAANVCSDVRSAVGFAANVCCAAAA